MIFLYVKVDFHDKKVGDDLIAHPRLTHTRRRQSQSETAACPMEAEIKSPRPPFPKGGYRKHRCIGLFKASLLEIFLHSPFGQRNMAKITLADGNRCLISPPLKKGAGGIFGGEVSRPIGVGCIDQFFTLRLVLFRLGRASAFWFLRSSCIRFNSSDAGSSLGSWGTSSPRKALARMDWVSLSTWALAFW